MQEARSSFNLKFYVGGFEAQLTVRDDDPQVLFDRVPRIVQAAKALGAEGRVTQPSNGNGKAKANGLAGPPLCPACKVPGLPIQRESQEKGPFTALECPRCQKFIPGTFRWAAKVA